MAVFQIFLFLGAFRGVTASADKNYNKDNRRLVVAIIESLQDSNFDSEILFDLKKENQVYLNRTMALVIKYIIKREVDSLRSRRTDTISRRIYSSLIMKFIDIAKDIPRNSSAENRIELAHRSYMSVESKDMHDEMADRQVFHACARLYDIMFTAPRIMTQLGNVDDLTPRVLINKLKAMQIKPVHLGILFLVQYHLRETINYAIKENIVKTLLTKPQQVGPEVIDILKVLAARLLPVSELLDLHISHFSPAFKDTCPSTWLGIVNNKT